MRIKRGFIWSLLYSSAWIKLALYLVIFVAIIGGYTLLFHNVYPILENKPISWSEAFFFVTETITTTGYGDLVPFSNAVTTYVAVAIMFSGIFMLFMLIPLLLAPYLSGILQAKPPQRTPFALSHHVVIIGYGELTRSLIESLVISDLEIVVVEKNEDLASECAKRYRNSLFVVWGDFTEPGTWTRAWIKNADHIIVCEEERTAASVILGIREQTKARIISVVDKLSYDRYLRYTGAEHVISPKHITGRILARHAVFTTHRDTTEATKLSGMPLDEVDEGGRSLRLIHIPIMPGSRAAGKTLRDLSLYERFGFEVLFISKNGQFNLQPSGDDQLDTSTRVFLLGRTEGLSEMIQNEFAADVSKRPLAVIAGFGDVGQAVYKEMTELGIECIVIDRKDYQINGTVGNAEDESTLTEARIEEANFCIVALNDDNVNIFTTLMARNLNNSIRILARANDHTSVDKLYRAGADYVSLLPMIGGQIIAGLVLSDIVKVILDLPGGQKVVRKPVMHQFSRTSGWVADTTGVRVLGIEGTTRSMVRPPRDEVLREGDSLIVVGDLVQLKKFIRTL